MAEISHTVTRVTTADTHTGDTAWTDVSGASIADTFFTVGQKYLLLVFAYLDGDTTSESYAMRAVHGSTAFSQAMLQWDKPGEAGASEGKPYCYFTVWTAVSGEAIKLQFRNVDATGDTVEADQVVLAAISLNDLTENTHWYFNEVVAATVLSHTAWTSSNNASVTVSANGSDDWLVLAASTLDGWTSVSSDIRSRINRDSDTEVAPEVGTRPRNIDGPDTHLKFMARRWAALASGSRTFREEDAEVADQGVSRQRSAVFALNLSQFTNNAGNWSETNTVLSTTDFGTELMSVNITPTNAGDVFVLAFAAIDQPDVTLYYYKARLQVDGTDTPASQTSDAYELNTDLIFNTATTGSEIAIFDIVNLSASLHNIDFDASKETGSNRDAEHFGVVAFTLDSPLASTDNADWQITATYV